MKAFKTLLLLLALGLSVYGQAVNVTANKLKGSATAPSGACSAQQVQLTTAGVVYVCASGTWTSSGGGTTINSTNGQVPYRVNSTTFGDSAISSNALSATGISVTSAAAGSGVTVGVTSSGSNEDFIVAPKGTGKFSVSSSIDSFTAPFVTFGSSVGITQATAQNRGLYLFGNYSLFVGATAYNNPDAGSLVTATAIATRGDLGEIGFGTGTNPSVRDSTFRRSGTNTIRVANGSTGAGQLLIGTSTDTADAQLSVYSQSTTRPSLKLRALSGSGGTQNALENYNAAGSLSAQLDQAGIGAFYSIYAHGGSGVGISYAEMVRTTLGVAVYDAGTYSWSSTSVSGGAKDLILARDAANTLAQRNGTNAQTFRVYNTYTSGSNYERLGIQASSNAFFITPEAATGTVRELVAGAAGSVTRIRSSLATPSAPALADGDWWVECSGTSPARTCSILVRDTGATRTIATSAAF
jgi:hypothetical protein